MYASSCVIRNPLHTTLFTDIIGLFLVFEPLTYLAIFVFLIVCIHSIVATMEVPDLAGRFGVPSSSSREPWWESIENQGSWSW